METAEIEIRVSKIMGVQQLKVRNGFLEVETLPLFPVLNSFLIRIDVNSIWQIFTISASRAIMYTILDSFVFFFYVLKVSLYFKGIIIYTSVTPMNCTALREEVTLLAWL